jgi:hypothetical protein
MKTQEQKAEEFNELVKPVMKWMAENLHPHTKIIIESNNAELVEGCMNVNTNEYLID